MNNLSEFMMQYISEDESKRKILDTINLDLYNEKQKIELLFGIKHGCTPEQLKICTNNFEENQIKTIIECFIDGLSIEQVKIIAKPCFDFLQMLEMKKAFKNGLAVKQVENIANLNISPLKMMRAYLSIQYKEGLKEAKEIFLYK